MEQKRKIYCERILIKNLFGNIFNKGYLEGSWVKIKKKHNSTYIKSVLFNKEFYADHFYYWGWFTKMVPYEYRGLI